MNELLQHLAFGFSVAFTGQNLAYCLLGAVLGTAVGVLPGLNPIIVITMLLPLTFKIPATAALIMLSGIYYGAHHAGSTTAIMLNMPGEPSSLVICIEGHPMARKGRAGVALAISALGSFVAGCLCILIIALFSPPLAHAALSFEAPDYAAAVVLALVAVCVLSTRSLALTLGMAVIGMLIGCVGTDVNTGMPRYTFGLSGLSDGIDFVDVAVGVFAIAEIAHRLASSLTARVEGKISSLIPSREELRASWLPILRGTALGGALGILPGTGPLISSFASYAIEKRLARDPSRFGSGAIEGVAGPEAANNAAAFTHFIPMLTLGIPAGATMALMLGAMLIQGIAPGPRIMTQHPDLFWGLIASMWLGNLMLLVLNLPLIGVWVRLLQTPYRLLYPMILVLCCIGVYSVRNSVLDVIVAMLFGAIGFLFKKLDCPPAPLMLGVVLGPILEENVRRALLVSNGDLSVFVRRPASAGLLLIGVLLLATFSLPNLRRRVSGLE